MNTTVVSEERVIVGLPNMRTSIQSQPEKGWAIIVSFQIAKGPVTLVIGKDATISMQAFLRHINMRDMIGWFPKYQDASNFAETITEEIIHAMHLQWSIASQKLVDADTIERKDFLKLYNEQQ